MNEIILIIFCALSFCAFYYFGYETGKAATIVKFYKQMIEDFKELIQQRR